MIVGRNDAGKSTIFEALNIFFGDGKIDQDDANKSGDPTDVAIVCEFEDFPEQIVIDKDYPTNLQNEFLLNKEGRLELHQIWDCTKKTPKAAMYAMANHPSAQRVDDLLELKITDLRSRAKELGADLSDVDQKVSSQLRGAIRSTVDDLVLCDRLLQLDKDSGKKLWEQLKLSLPTFALFKADRSSTDTDPEAQDPMNAAMKEAFKGLEPKLNALVDQVKNEVQSTADKTVEKLREMHPELAGELKARFTEPNWSKVLKVSLTGEEDIPLNKRGSGVRRLVLLNFFRAKAESNAYDRGEDVPVIYAIEEPETSQHPANQKLLLNALLELSENPGRQVLLTSHNPVLARRIPSSCIRHVCDNGGCRSVEGEGGEREVLNKLAKDLGVLPDHDVKLFIGVEGVNDIHFLQSMSTMLIANGVDVPDLVKLDEKGIIIFIPCGGTNLSLWAHRLAGLNRPEFHLFDGDKQQNEITAQTVSERGEGCIGLCTKKYEMENYLHVDAIVAVKSELVGLVEFGDRDDVPTIVAKAVHFVSGAQTGWAELEPKKQKEKGSRAKKWLNTEAVRAMTPELLEARDPGGEVMGWFNAIAKHVNV